MTPGRTASRQHAEAEATRLGIPLFTDSRIDRRVARMIPAELVRRHRLLPVAQHRARVVIAMVSPADKAAQDAVREATGLRVEVQAIDEADWKRLVDSLIPEEPPHEAKDEPTFFTPLRGGSALPSPSPAASPATTTQQAAPAAAMRTRRYSSPAAEQPAQAERATQSPYVVSRDAGTKPVTRASRRAARASAESTQAPLRRRDRSAQATSVEVAETGKPLHPALLLALQQSATAIHIDLSPTSEHGFIRQDGELVDLENVAGLVDWLAAAAPRASRAARSEPSTNTHTVIFDGNAIELFVSRAPLGDGERVTITPAVTPAEEFSAISHTLSEQFTFALPEAGLILVGSPDQLVRRAGVVAAANGVTGKRIIARFGEPGVEHPYLDVPKDHAGISEFCERFDVDVLLIDDLRQFPGDVLELAIDRVVIAGVRSFDTASALHSAAYATADPASLAALTTDVVAIPSRKSSCSCSRRSENAFLCDNLDAADHPPVYQHLAMSSPVRATLADRAALSRLRKVIFDSGSPAIESSDSAGTGRRLRSSGR